MSAVAYVNAERIKLVSTRSPWWCLGVAAVVAWGLTALIFGTAPLEALEALGPAGLVMGSELATVVLSIMTVLAVTSEYRFGTARSTFLAAPRRTGALLAKIGLLTVVDGVAVLAISLVSYLLATVLAPSGFSLSLSGADGRQVLGSGLTAMVTALFCCAVGLVIRQSAGAISVVLVWPLLIESLVPIIPHAGEHIHNWLPFARAKLFSDAAPGQIEAQGTLGPWWSLAYAAGIALALVVVGLVLAKRRDA